MNVDLIIHADQTLRLERNSNSDDNNHKLYVEVLETKTGLPYQLFEDFQLDKID